MTGKELRKLSRAELLQMLVDVTAENEELKSKVDNLEKELNDKNIKIANAGSIAEASLAINNVLEAAQAAADQYLHNIKGTNGTGISE